MEEKAFYDEMIRFMPALLRAVTIKGENVMTRGDVPLSQIAVIDVLSEKETCTMGELARELNFTMSALTVIVDKMVMKKLVKRERSRKDRRVVKVKLASGGNYLKKKIREFRRDISRNLFSCLTSEERNEYLRILKKVYRNITEDTK